MKYTDEIVVTWADDDCHIGITVIFEFQDRRILQVEYQVKDITLFGHSCSLLPFSPTFIKMYTFQKLFFCNKWTFKYSDVFATCNFLYIPPPSQKCFPTLTMKQKYSILLPSDFFY